MRTLAAVAFALLLAGLAAPPSHAQATPTAAPPAAVQVLQDPTGDQSLHAGTTPVGTPAGRYQAGDLTSLTVLESATDFTFTLGVAALPDSGEATFVESTQYGVAFAHHGSQYQVHVARSLIATADYFAALESFDPARQEWDWIVQLPVVPDPGAATMTVAVPRDQLLDADGAAPFPSRSLEGFHATSWGGFDSGAIGLGPAGQVPLPSVEVTDAMPDTGNGTVDLPVRLGIQQTGNARLASAVPTRASNGEATTFVFSVEAGNQGPKQRFRLGATGVPGGWSVQLPSDLVELDAGQNATLPVLVTTPFAHAHGTLQSFVLELQGLDHPDDVGRVQLGVRYTQPPQPAGHHDTVYLHTAKAQGDQTFNTAFGTVFGFSPEDMYFNTLTPDEDGNDAKTPEAGQAAGFFDPPGSVTYQWHLPLSPSLQLGLDVDLARTGSAKLAIDTLLPLPGAVLAGRLVHTAPDGRGFDNCDQGCRFTADDFYFGFGNHTTVARLGATPAKDVAANSNDVLFEAPVVGLPAGDFVPFARDATLTLELNLTFARPDPPFGPHDAPKLAGGEMQLPLNEYHDPVDRAFSSLAGLMVEVQGEANRMVNPGKTVVFDLQLMNHGTKDMEDDLTLSGTELPWARILGDTHVKVPAGGVRALGIAVVVPADARSGDVSDLVVTAADSKDPALRTLARVVATVDTAAEHPDDSARVPGLESQLHHKSSPGLAPALLLAAVAAVAVARRRRLA